MDRKILALLLVALVAGGAVAYHLLTQQEEIQRFVFGETLTGYAETPYGEKLEIKLDVGGETTSASWVASYTDTESQQVYTVNGTYKSQEQVTQSYSLSVSYTNVGSIQNVKTSITAVDTADSSSYEYILASNKALSGASPISDSGSTVVIITQHLTDAVADLNSATIDYKVYCKVTAVGIVSGMTLIAEIPLTKFATLQYQRSTEEVSGSVTPTVSVASWADIANQPEMLIILVLAILVVVVAAVPKKRKLSRQRRRRQAKKSA
jgi:hypothetical protein